MDTDTWRVLYPQDGIVIEISLNDAAVLDLNLRRTSLLIVNAFGNYGKVRGNWTSSRPDENGPGHLNSNVTGLPGCLLIHEANTYVEQMRIHPGEPICFK